MNKLLEKLIFAIVPIIVEQVLKELEKRNKENK